MTAIFILWIIKFYLIQPKFFRVVKIDVTYFRLVICSWSNVKLAWSWNDRKLKFEIVSISFFLYYSSLVLLKKKKCQTGRPFELLSISLSNMCGIMAIQNGSYRSRKEQLILFPENLNVSRETSLRVSCYIAGNFEAGNSLNLVVTALVGQHSRVTVHCYPLTS